MKIILQILPMKTLKPKKLLLCMFIPGTEVSPIQFIMYSARERRNARISLNRKHFFNFKTLGKKVIMKQQSKVLALLEVLKKTPVCTGNRFKSSSFTVLISQPNSTFYFGKEAQN